MSYSCGDSDMGIAGVHSDYLNNAYLKFMYKKFGEEYKNAYKIAREKSWEIKAEEYATKTNEIIKEMTR